MTENSNIIDDLRQFEFDILNGEKERAEGNTKLSKSQPNTKSTGRTTKAGLAYLKFKFQILSAIFFTGLFISLACSAIYDGTWFPAGFLNSVAGNYAGKLVLTTSNLAPVIFTAFCLISAFLFLLLLPELHLSSSAFYDGRLISPRTREVAEVLNYVGIISIIVGIGGLMADSLGAKGGILYPSLSEINSFWSTVILPPPQYVLYGGIAFGGVAYGLLGVMGVAFISRRIGGAILSCSATTFVIIGVMQTLTPPLFITTSLNWIVFILQVAWMTPFFNRLLNPTLRPQSHPVVIPSADVQDLRVLQLLGITSVEQLAEEEDPLELSIILDIAVQEVLDWIETARKLVKKQQRSAVDPLSVRNAVTVEI
jgi:hypothetical protein